MIIFRILSKILLVAVVLILSCSKSPEFFEGKDKELTAKDITQNRNMKLYEDGGQFWCHTVENGEKKVRDFIWQNWTEKKRGYVKLSCSGGKDVLDTAHYFIEQNDKGEWNIVRRQISRLNEKFFLKDDVLNSVERIENKNIDDWTLISKTSNGEIKLQLP